MRRVVFWGAIPFVLPQALRLRRAARRLPPPPGEPSGLAGEGRVLRLLAVGDSIAAGVGAVSHEGSYAGRLAHELAARLGRAVAWRSIGRVGATTDGILRDVVRRLDGAPADVILLTTGVNDITGLLRSRRYRRNLEALLAGLSSHSPGATIAVSGVPPLEHFPLLPQPLRGVLALRARQFDAIARRASSRHPSAVHVPIRVEAPEESFAVDGFHPSDAGYARLAAVAASRLVDAMNGRDRAGRSLVSRS